MLEEQSLKQFMDQLKKDEPNMKIMGDTETGVFRVQLYTHHKLLLREVLPGNKIEFRICAYVYYVEHDRPKDEVEISTFWNRCEPDKYEKKFDWNMVGSDYRDRTISFDISQAGSFQETAKSKADTDLLRRGKAAANQVEVRRDKGKGRSRKVEGTKSMKAACSKPKRDRRD